MSTRTLPTFFVSHGGGPWPWMKNETGPLYAELERSLRAMPAQIGERPKAVLMISAHWEAPEFTLMTNPAPGMLYDYGGFPEHTYHVTYPAPGAPAVAARVRELLVRAAHVAVHPRPRAAAVRDEEGREGARAHRGDPGLQRCRPVQGYRLPRRPGFKAAECGVQPP